MTFVERLRAGEVVVGSFVTTPAPGIVEVMGLVGFDFVVIDMEHAGLDVHQTEDLIRAAEVRGCAPLVRVTTASSHHVLRALDSGAVGVHVPDVSTAIDGRAAVANAKYGPLGRRGLASVRAADFGLTADLPEYVARANQETIVVAHIESRLSLEELDKLITVAGIDVYYLGPVDLSNDFGIPGETSDPRVRDAVDDAIARIINGGKVAGCIVNSNEQVAHYRSLGATYFACHALRFLASGSRRFLELARQ